ncbi:MAG TPA: YlxR family protein [Micromonosporaceae bacterium]|nr:YlxR family protein [Micromonosporaceae bacterium]
MVRTCVGCRKRADVFELLRVVATGTGAERTLVPDPARRLSGRGAHLHPDPACLALAERRRAFGRALRVTGVLDPGPLAEHIRAATAPSGTTDGGGSAPTGDQQGRTTDMSTR